MAEPVIARARLPGATWLQVETFAKDLSEFCKVHVSPDRVVTVPMTTGEIALHWTAISTMIRVRANSSENLQVLRDTLGHMLEGVTAGLTESLLWQSEEPLAGSLPPNFRIARLLHRRSISPRFQRLRLAADDLSFMAQSGLHFRLLQPRDAGAPSWPRLAANGRTVWPGAADLHMPVYTVRAIDAEAGWLDVDVYIHGNGPTCRWAQSASPGDIVGISGPGGGWLPEGNGLLLGGDETALPVIARILEVAPTQACGRAIIEVTDRDEVQELNHPERVTVQWLIRGQGPSLQHVFESEMDSMLTYTPHAEIVFGGEKADAQMLRNGLRRRYARTPENVKLAAYWSR